MGYRDYLATTNDTRDLLTDWRWLIGSHLKLWHVTKFADVLLMDAAGGIYFLDTLEGAVSKIANSEAEFVSKAESDHNADHWFMAGLVDGAARRGMSPAAEECLSFKFAPQLGGPIDLDNVEVSSLILSLSISGQIRQQIKDLPDGTKIKEVRVEPDGGLTLITSLPHGGRR